MAETNNQLPKKRINPLEKEFDIFKEEPNKTTKKPVEKKSVKTTNTKETPKTTKKSSESTKTTKKPATSKDAKKPTSKKKKPTPKINTSHISSTRNIDPRTGLVKSKEKKTQEKKQETKVVETKAPVVKKVKKKTPKVLTIEPVVDNTPKVVVRPTPKKEHNWNKEEKILYKQLEESFNTIANMTTVIEERTMDTKNIPNLTIGELHLIEMVNRYNNKPMTLIANKLHITVGAMTICLNRLVQKGYLLRTRDEMDRRVILLSITQDGKKILKFHNKFHDDILGLVLDTLPLQQTAKVLNQIAYVLEYYYDPSIAKTEEKKQVKKGKK